MKHLLTWILYVPLALFGQANKPAPKPAVTTAPAPSAPLSVAPEAYLFPPEDRLRLRDLQHTQDQLEIANQKMLVQIEQNKAKEDQVIFALKSIAADFATKKGIDLDKYELDPAQLKMVRKKTQGAK